MVFPETQSELFFRHECFARGVFLGYGHLICFFHTREDIKWTIKISNEVFNLISNMLEDKKNKINIT